MPFPTAPLKAYVNVAQRTRPSRQTGTSWPTVISMRIWISGAAMAGICRTPAGQTLRVVLVPYSCLERSDRAKHDKESEDRDDVETHLYTVTEQSNSSSDWALESSNVLIG